MIPIINNEVTFQLQRNPDNGTSTLGNISLGELSLFTIEDVNRDLNHDGDITDPGEEKVYGESRIACGRYEIVFREEGTLHEKYKDRFTFHRGMLWLRDVKSFKYIYLHIANAASQLLGCIGIASHKVNDNWIDDSEKAYVFLYGYCCCLFDLGYRVFINIMDEK